MTITAARCTFVCMVLLVGIVFGAAHQYQNGKIVKVDTQQSTDPSGGPDAPLKAETATHRVSIQLGNTVYVCTYQTSAEPDLSWAVGKDVEARVRGKVIYVKKANGKEAKASILSATPVANP